MALLRKIIATINGSKQDINFYIGFDQVFRGNSENNNNTGYSLADFFTQIQDFFKQPMFMKYARPHGAIETPVNGSTIMEYYCVTGDGIDQNVKNV